MADAGGGRMKVNRLFVGIVCFILYSLHDFLPSEAVSLDALWIVGMLLLATCMEGGQ